MPVSLEVSQSLFNFMLLLLEPLVLIKVNFKHITEHEWISKETTCHVGRGSLNMVISGETYAFAFISQPSCLTLYRADGLPLRCKGQRVY